MCPDITDVLAVCNGKWLLRAWAGSTCIGVFGQCRKVTPESKQALTSHHVAAGGPCLSTGHTALRALPLGDGRAASRTPPI